MNIDAISNNSAMTSFNTSNKDAKASSVQKGDVQPFVQAIHDIHSNLLEEDALETDVLETEEGKAAFQEVLNAANEVIFGSDSHFEFQIHEKTGNTMVKVIDNKTDEVIREFPPEKILNAVAGIWELAGIIVDEKA